MTSASASPQPVPVKNGAVQDLEIKDAQVIFDAVWHNLEKTYGRENLAFPRELFWLNGAPGAGKGTNTRFIMQYRDYSSSPIVVSDLLQSPEARKRIDAGMLVGDREVIEILLKKLLEPEFIGGAVIDGFPRTLVQVEFLKLFYNRLNELRAEFMHTKHGRFPRPQFHILVLFVDENESVRRQLKRGQEAVVHNSKVHEAGEGVLMEVRKTDLDPEAARGRYRIFKERTYEPLQTLREMFHYHLINAHGSFHDVEQRIIKELQYQSSLELSEKTFDLIAPIPLSVEIIKHARQDLVRRLDEYTELAPERFKRIVELIQSTLMPVVIRHAMSGQAHVNIESDLFEEGYALDMFIDVFSERGYHADVDVHHIEVPEHVDPVTYQIKTRVKKIYRISIRFRSSEIRRGM
jgi:adenylate kinase